MLSNLRVEAENDEAVLWAMAYDRFGMETNWRDLTHGWSRSAIVRIKRKMWAILNGPKPWGTAHD